MSLSKCGTRAVWNIMVSAVIEPVGRSFMSGSAGQPLHVGVHDDRPPGLGEGTQEVAVVGLLNGFDQRHSVFGHRVLLGSR
jgi:hypothetical protein